MILLSHFSFLFPFSLFPFLSSSLIPPSYFLVSHFSSLFFFFFLFFSLFKDSWFKHFDIEERGKRPGHTGLAPQLFVKEVIPAEQRGTHVCTCIHIFNRIFIEAKMSLFQCWRFCNVLHFIFLSYLLLLSFGDN